MYRWAWIVSGIYALIVGALILPAVASSVMAVGGDNLWSGWQLFFSNGDSWIAVSMLMLLFALAQLALLCVPVRVASRRPLTRGPLWITILAAAAAMAGLLFGISVCAWELSCYESTCTWDRAATDIPALVVVVWLTWTLYFLRVTRPDRGGDVTRRLSRWLLSGSVLELLVAVPSHIVARRRAYCCAGAGTAIGLACGLSVMLFAFGPAVYVLFADRWRRLHPAAADDSKALRRGTTPGT